MVVGPVEEEMEIIVSHGGLYFILYWFVIHEPLCTMSTDIHISTYVQGQRECLLMHLFLSLVWWKEGSLAIGLFKGMSLVLD